MRCDETTSFIGERIERLENVVVSKHVNMHTWYASSEVANYVEKLQCIVYEQK